MATPAYTRPLGSLDWADQNGHILGAPPAGFRWVVRDLIITNLGASAETYQFYLHTGSVGLHFYRGEVPAGTSHHEEMRQTVEPGETIDCMSVGGAHSTIVVTGYQLYLTTAAAREMGVGAPYDPSDLV